jgi:hypothetical protein
MCRLQKIIASVLSDRTIGKELLSQLLTFLLQLVVLETYKTCIGTLGDITWPYNWKLDTCAHCSYQNISLLLLDFQVNIRDNNIRFI